MSGKTPEVLYVKYNSTRQPAFRLTTEICAEGTERFVCKRAAGKEAETHLQMIRRNHEILQDYYTDIRVIPAKEDGDSLRFPYVRGETLEHAAGRQQGKEAYLSFVQEKLERVLSVKDAYRVPFEPCEAFEAMFGKTDLAGVPALNPANIDSLLSNFIENDEGVFCIDCEWVCPFPVPENFIRFRILLYLYTIQTQNLNYGITLEEMLAYFGIPEDEAETCRKMDDRFQQYVHGENRKYIYPERYRKPDLSIAGVSRKLQEQEASIANLEHVIANLEHVVSLRDQAIQDKEVHIRNLDKIIRDRENHIRQLTDAFNIISNSFFWKITGPARKTLDGVKAFARKNKKLYPLLRMVKDIPRHGFKYANNRRKEYMDGKKKASEAAAWPTEETRAAQRKEAFPKEITFSVLVPLYNTPEAFLREMIESVVEQTYPKWELCLADGSDAEHAFVGKICQEYARKDKRILYRKLEENYGISGNTNACIEMAGGDYIALFDHDDLLHPSALYEVMKAICEQNADFVYTDEVTFESPDLNKLITLHFKPDFAPDTLRANNYICHLTVFKKDLLEKAGGGFRSEFDGSQDFDLVLRLTEQARRIVHIPKVLYYWRAHKDSVAECVDAKPYVIGAAKKAISEHLKRVGLEGEVLDSMVPSMYRLKYKIQGEPLISILIPNMDHTDDLRRCVDSILGKSTYSNYEIVIIENNSTKAETFAYYEELEKNPRIRVVTWNGPFNFSAINNFGFREAKGDHILLLNNDTEVIAPEWLQEMLMYSQRTDVGAVGAKLYYPDHTIQHAGLGIGLLTLAGHYHRHFDGNHPGYMGRLIYAQDLSGVTAACMMIPRHVYEEMGGLDESFEVAFNDVDLCMRIRKAGYLIVFTPFAELYHYESKSRGLDNEPEKRARFMSEVTRFQKRWARELAAGDPYYNPNLSLEKEDFSIREA